MIQNNAILTVYLFKNAIFMMLETSYWLSICGHLLALPEGYPLEDGEGEEGKLLRAP